MCGIVGFLAETGLLQDTAQLAKRMADSLLHRGPDDSGVWVDEAAGVALAHRRLSILDLSPAGRQPMISACERYVMVFNGEIYNHLQLRRELERGDTITSWRGHSDTETLLEAIAAWGVETALKKSVGMFAFALWDRKERTLTLARDRLGEKPLYYGWQGEVFLFGSELKALKAHPAFHGEVNRESVALFLRHSYIPAPYCIYKGIYKLPPGAFLTLRPGQREVKPLAYWSVREVAERGQAEPFTGTEEEAQEELERLLKHSLAGQMIADVPLGAFLSGGVDSSTVVALMQVQSKCPVKTFTIGFWELGYNEAEHAKAVARHLGTDHTELYITPEDALSVIPKLPEIYDEPFSDSSQIPTFLVSELARRHVTVSLSGDGGDELFSGYNRYFLAMRYWRRLGKIPGPLRAALAGILTTLPPTAWDRAFQGISRFLPARLRYANLTEKLYKLADILSARTPEEVYFSLVSHWKRPADVVQGGREPPTLLTSSSQWAPLPDFELSMMYLDTITYLPDDILTKVDRAAMSVSLETRMPFLDHRVVEFAWQLPLAMKIRNGQGKWILRQVLYKYVPRSLIERPKTGFSVPIDAWLRGPLKDWAEGLLDAGRLRREGFFNPAPVREKWLEHLSGRGNLGAYLWDVLMFQAWLEHVGS